MRLVNADEYPRLKPHAGLLFLLILTTRLRWLFPFSHHSLAVYSHWL